MRITTQDVAYYENVTGFLACPEDGETYPGVVVIHENRGLNDTIKAHAEKIAAEGFVALAVDLFGRTVPTVEEGMALTAQYNPAKGMENMRAAVRYVKEKGTGRVGSIGFCFGGAQSLNLALSGETLDATVIFYGRLNTDKGALAAIKWPVLGIFAGEDKHITPEHVHAFEQALAELGREKEIIIYPGVDHAFANPANPQYAPQETEDAWKRTLAFLKKHLK